MGSLSIILYQWIKYLTYIFFLVKTDPGRKQGRASKMLGRELWSLVTLASGRHFWLQEILAKEACRSRCHIY